MRRILITLLAGIVINCLHLNAQAHDHIPGQLLVKLTGKNATQKVQRDLWTIDNRYISLKWERQVSKVLNIWLLSFDEKSINENDLLRIVKQQPNVLEAQFNHNVKLRDTTPNDPSLSDQWQWINNGGPGAKADADVDAEKAWDITTGGLTPYFGDTIVVCIVDDGTELNHPDLKANLFKNWGEIPNDGIDNDGNGYIDDFDGWNINSDDDNVSGGNHGVSVAGMIGATGNNGIGITGINWHVKLMTVKYGEYTEDEVIEAYDYPYIMRKLYNDTKGKKGAFVVATNSSWGIDNANPLEYPLWCSFYDTLGSVGILSCGATSNNTVDVDLEGDMPTGCTSNYLISVGRTNKNDASAGGFGVKNIDLGAPGVNIYTTANNNNYTFETGTSFSTPLVAGIVGLMYSAPCANFAIIAHAVPSQAALLLRKYILDGVDIIPGFETKYVTAGRANAYGALQQLLANCSACQPPGEINIVPVSDVAADISWIKSFDTNLTNIEYRITGAPNFTIIDSIPGSSYTLSGLLSCTEYEIRFSSLCEDSLSVYSDVYKFKTLGCCENPGNITATVFDDSTVYVHWDPLFGSKGYEIDYKKTGDLLYNTISTQEDSVIITSLANCAVYEIILKTTCSTGLTASDTLYIKTTGCGACEDGNYCPSQGEEFTEEWIANFSINDIDNDSEGEGYHFFTNLYTLLYPGLSYSVSVTPGFNGFGFDEYFKVFIDYNQDGDFDDVSELVWDAGLTQVEITTNITVPLDAKGGNTRLRVVMGYPGLGNGPPEACGPIIFGETEDYCIEIFAPQAPCATPENLDTLSVGETSATLKWDHPSPGAISYTLRYKIFEASNWTYIYNIAAPPVTIVGLTDNTNYVWEVQAICATDSSGFTQPKGFTTLETVGTKSVIEGSNFKVFPNPFNNQLTLSWSGKTNPERIDICDPLGKVVKTENLAQGVSSVQLNNLNELSPGMYIVRIKTKEQVYFKKIIRQ